MLASIALLAVLVGGFFVSSWIAARLRGWLCTLALLAWLAVPYGLLWFVATPDDPTLDASHAAYDHQFTFVVMSLLITIPWLLLVIFGMQRGWRRRPPGQP